MGYTNTLPFQYGLNREFISGEIDLQLDFPAICAKKVLDKKVDIGLVPVAILNQNPDLKIISDYCISANGKVDSVILYSDQPVYSLKKIILDYQSRTSVQLVKILCKELWNIQPVFTPADFNFIDEISDTTGGVVIGDRTFKLKDRFKYSYDLSENWQKLTGLPFVFACWVSTTEIPSSFLNRFNTALKYGTTNIEQSIILNNAPDGLNNDECDFYLTKRIEYELSENKKKGLALFLSKLMSFQS